MARFIIPKPLPDKSVILASIRRGSITPRTLAKKYGVEASRMMKLCAQVHRENMDEVSSSWYKVGDGSGHPSQELVYSSKEVKA